MSTQVELANIDGKVFVLPSTLEEFQIVERMEDTEIVKVMSGEISEKYFYRFTHSGKEVIDLSAVGIFEIAQKYGGIEIEVQVISDKDSPDYECQAYALDKKRDIKFSGAAQQEKVYPNGKKDEFALAKANTKSQRNAIKKLFPYKMIKSMLLNFIVYEEEQELIIVQETTKQKLQDYGIKEEVFNEYCNSKYDKLFHELDVDTAKRASAMLVKKDFREMLKEKSINNL